MKDTNCLFCKIASGEIPSSKVYEDADTFAFLDIKPVNPGHLLVIPKEHYENIFEVPTEILTRMIETMKKMAHALKDSLGIENGNIVMNNGEHAGQTVFHAHLHFIPRHPNDGNSNLWLGKAYEEGQANEIVEKLKNAL